MLLNTAAVIAGLVVLVWSADRFVDGASATAKHLGMPTLLIGMLIVGFGTSAPEIVVSTIASSQGNPGLALGNAIGSNIANIALILGITALIIPITVHSSIIKRELPLLIAISAFAILLLLDGNLSRLDGILMLVCFVIVMGWSIYIAMRKSPDALANEFDQELSVPSMPLKLAIFWLLFGLVLLVASSRLLVWGSVNIAVALGVSDLVIGLTVVAIGTSLPELASSIAATRKNEHDIALGNVIGSNMFNTLMVIGLAGVIHPLPVEHAVIYRDLPVMGLLTLTLFVFAFGFRREGRINRVEGGFLLLSWISYTAWLVLSALKQLVQ